MRIAFVCDWYLPRVGGIEHQMRDVARELNRRGHEVRIITATPGLPLIDGVWIERLDARRLPRVGTIFCLDAVRALDNVLRQGRFDVVHAHSLWSPLALLSMWAARRCGIPTVLSNHSLLDGTGIALFRLLDARIGWAGWPEILTAPSQLSCEETASATRRSVRLLRNCVDASGWQCQPRGGPVRQIASVLRLAPRKAPLALVAAIPRVLERLAPAARPQFVIAGDGPLRPRIERALKRARLGEHVKLTGFVSRTRLRSVFAESQLFVHPTLQEAFGIALLEARAAGLPVVAMRRSGARDVVDEEQTGLLADDPSELVEHLVTLIRDHELRQRMAAAAPLGLERWALSAVADDHLALYKALL
jgi:glycosyltransferase involved in cell wall biosynthesis